MSDRNPAKKAICPVEFKSRFDAASFSSGIRRAFSIVLAYIVIGMTFGVTARETGLTVWETGLMSVIVYAGSAQFIGVSMIGMLAGFWPVVITTFLVNLRHTLMSASLSPYLHGFRLRTVGCLGFGLTDETFSLMITDLQENARDKDNWFLAGVELISYLSWVTASIAGAGLGTLIARPEQWGLDFALPAMFIALLALQFDDWTKIAVAAIASVLSVVSLLTIPGNWNIIIAAVVAASAGVVIKRCNRIYC